MATERDPATITVELKMSTSGSGQMRRFTRTTVLAEVLWDHRTRERDSGEIMDISPKGLFMAASAGLPEDLLVGDVVWGEFAIGDSSFSFAAKVRWRGYSSQHRRSGVGVEFTEPPSIPAELLRNFVARHSLRVPR